MTFIKVKMIGTKPTGNLSIFDSNSRKLRLQKKNSCSGKIITSNQSYWV